MLFHGKPSLHINSPFMKHCKQDMSGIVYTSPAVRAMHISYTRLTAANKILLILDIMYNFLTYPKLTEYAITLPIIINSSV